MYRTNISTNFRNYNSVPLPQRAVLRPERNERVSLFQRIKNAFRNIFSSTPPKAVKSERVIAARPLLPTSRPLLNHRAVLRRLGERPRPLPHELITAYQRLAKLQETRGARIGLEPGRIKVPRSVPIGVKVLPSPRAREESNRKPLSRRRVRVQPPPRRPEQFKVQAVVSQRLKPMPPPRRPKEPKPVRVQAVAPQNLQPEESRVQAASPKGEEPENLPILYHHLNSYFETLKKTEKDLETFVNLYQNHRDRFEALMRKEGLTDLETSFLFNHFSNMHEVFSKWNTEFEQLVQLAKEKGKTAEVMQKFKSMIENRAPQLIDSLNKLNIIGDSLLNNEGIGRAIIKFGNEMGVPNFHHLVFSRLYNPAASQKLLLFYKDAVKHAEKDGLIELVELQDPPKILIDKLKEANGYQDNFQRRFKTGNQFINFFNFEGLDKAQYRDILKKYGWTEGWFSTKIEQFNDLNNKLAQYIKPLKESKEAIYSETDPVKKKELKAQREKLVKKILPQAKQVIEKYNRLGGKKQLNTLKKIAREITIIMKENYRTHLRELHALVTEDPNKYKELQLSSRPAEIVCDLMDHLEDKIAEVPDAAKRERRRAEFEKELTLVQKLAYIKETSGRAEALVDLFLDRLYYFQPGKKR